MGKDILMFGNTEIEKKMYYCKIPILLKDVNIAKVLVSKKISFGEKVINTLLITCIMIIKLSHYI